MARRTLRWLRGHYAAKLAVSLLLIVGLLVAYGAVAQEETAAQVRADAREELTTRAGLQATELDTWLSSVKRDARATSVHPAVRTGDGESTHEYLHALVANDRVPEGVVAVHYLDRSSMTFTASSMDRFEGVAPAEQGAPFGSQPPSFDGTDDVYVTSTFRIEAVDFPVVAVLSPVPDGDGAIVYMIDVEKRAASIAAGEGDHSLLVVDGDGRYIAHPDGSKVGTPADRSLGGAALAGEAGFVTANGEATAYARMTETEWTVMVREPTGQAFAVARDVRSSFAGLILIGVVSLALVGASVGSSTAIALRELSATARRMAEGDLDVSLSTGRSDEIGQLYAAFDRMRESLRSQIEEAESARADAEQARAEAESINRQLKDTAAEYEAAMRAAADNDLTRRVETDGRHEAMAAVGRELNAMLEEIESTIARLDRFAGDVVATAEEVDDRTAEVRQAGAEVSKATAEISGGATEQTERLGEAADETESLSASAEEIAATVDTISETTRRAAAAGESGREAAAAAIERMDEVEADADAAVERIEALEAEMAEIGEIVDVIRDIAEQTNTLALNASIEAARAGAESEGFAVVADEVKSLAEQTKESAVEIETRIERIQTRTDETAGTVREASEGVTAGAATVEEAVEELDRVVELVAEADDGVQEITAATDEQATAAQTVSESVESVAAISRRTTRQAETAAAAADQQVASLEAVSGRVNELHDRADDLEGLLRSFEVRDGGATAGGAQSAAVDGRRAPVESDFAFDATEGR